MPSPPSTPTGNGSGSGERLVEDRYRLLEVIGRGGMGVVWRAWDEMLQRSVAVKEVSRPPGLSDADAGVLSERTLREARTAGLLSNPHVVTIYDVVLAEGHPWIVMELLDAVSLAAVVKSEGRLPPQRVARIGLQVLSALEDAQRHGMLHRDVKPGNVMLGAGDWVTLTDFGLATVSGDPHLTTTGMLVGSPSYIAPERARGDAAVGSASDLWSLGATLYAAVEGRAPFDRGDAMATLSAVLTEEPAQMRHAGPLEGVLVGLLRKDPAARYDVATTHALLTHVATLGGGDTRTTTPGPGALPPATAPPATAPPATAPPATAPSAAATPAPPSPRSSRRKWAALAAAAVAVLIVAGILGYLATRDDGATTEPSPGVSPTASPDASSVPSGYRHYENPSGYSLAVPLGWPQSGSDERTDFTDPESGALLRVEHGPANPAGALAAWEQAEAAWAASAPEYQLISLGPVDYRGWDTAEWEWTDSNAGTQRHVRNRTFVVGDTGYAIMLSTPMNAWTRLEPVFSTAVDTYRPPGA